MKAAVCFDGVDDAALVEGARPLLAAFDAIEAWCAYGDVVERELAYVMERHGRPAPHPPHEHGPNEHIPPHEHGPRQPMLDEEEAQAIAERGTQLLREAGFPAFSRALTGRDAGHALVEAAGERVTLIIGAGHRRGIGPKSIGHVARFVIDHARAPVLVVRLREPEA